jgi:hypothetical protein
VNLEEREKEGLKMNSEKGMRRDEIRLTDGVQTSKKSI